ncbi:MAG TPA: DUF5343 domain-containing protein [Rhizobiaceae bacterium]|nr:DUF5343 domain-containing protein [Rhizobiaceae bacterium]
MATPLPYLASNKNVPTLFEKIASAKVPDTFSQAFLANTIGLKGSNDRALIPLLRNLGFVDQSNTPTPAYRVLKGHERRRAIADGIRRAYGPLFDADQDAHKLPADRLKSLVAQVGGTDADTTARIASTFNALSKAADFDAEAIDIRNDTPDLGEVRHSDEDAVSVVAQNRVLPHALRPEFHYNIQIHLPANGDEETYLNIFNAIRKTFQ